MYCCIRGGYCIRIAECLSYGDECLRRSDECLGRKAECLSRKAQSCGQASVEAALLLPAILCVLALLLEPVCMGYTRSIMCGAATECLRVASTDYDGNVDDCKNFVLRRLEAVPEIPIFHVGGKSDWDINISLDSDQTSVRIRGHIRPLPLYASLLSLFEERDAEGVVLQVHVSGQTRPSWVGGSYAQWQTMWG